MTNRQCSKCPWKIATDPHEIRNGYDPKKHAGLRNTIAQPGVPDLRSPLRVMACHETPEGCERPCVGWLHNQLNDGNNIVLRLAVHAGRYSAKYELDGPQHARFEDTLPKDDEPR
jgi:hypothetical protein